MNILVTGTSSGIGYALTREYLQNGAKVFGISRRCNDKLAEFPDYHHLSHDLLCFDNLQEKVKELLRSKKTIDLVILNAGMLPDLKDLRETSMDEIKKVMNVNVWANKLIMDTMIDEVPRIYQVVAISSGASISGARGWNVYAISKAALNMMIQLYARELPETHFTALAPGVVDTAMQEYISGLPEDKRFPVIDRLKEIRGTSQMPGPEDAANYLVEAIGHVLQFESGSYVDVRDLYFR